MSSTNWSSVVSTSGKSSFGIEWDTRALIGITPKNTKKYISEKKPVVIAPWGQITTENWYIDIENESGCLYSLEIDLGPVYLETPGFSDHFLPKQGETKDGGSTSWDEKLSAFKRFWDEVIRSKRITTTMGDPFEVLTYGTSAKELSRLCVSDPTCKICWTAAGLKRFKSVKKPLLSEVSPNDLDKRIIGKHGWSYIKKLYLGKGFFEVCKNNLSTKCLQKGDGVIYHKLMNSIIGTPQITVGMTYTRVIDLFRRINVSYKQFKQFGDSSHKLRSESHIERISEAFRRFDENVDNDKSDEANLILIVIIYDYLTFHRYNTLKKEGVNVSYFKAYYMLKFRTNVRAMYQLLSNDLQDYIEEGFMFATEDIPGYEWLASFSAGKIGYVIDKVPKKIKCLVPLVSIFSMSDKMKKWCDKQKVTYKSVEYFHPLENTAPELWYTKNSIHYGNKTGQDEAEAELLRFDIGEWHPYIEQGNVHLECRGVITLYQLSVVNNANASDNWKANNWMTKIKLGMDIDKLTEIVPAVLKYMNP